MAGLEYYDYGDLTDAPDEIVTDVLEAAEHAYRHIVDESYFFKGEPYDTIHTQGICIDVTNGINRYLLQVDKGYQTGPITLVDPSKNSHLISGLRRPDLSDELYIADGSWQQYLADGGNPNADGPPRQPNMPRVLIGTPRKVASVALGYGFSPNEAKMWKLTETIIEAAAA